MSKLDFNNQEEKDTVEEVFRNAILCLNEEDRNLPAIELMLPLLQRGIAVHHSGLLPVIKELVEILFQEGLVKALFATETVRLSPSICLLPLYPLLDQFYGCLSLYLKCRLTNFLITSFVTVCHGIKHAGKNCCFHSCQEVGW